MRKYPRCDECKFYIEDEDVRTKKMIGYCTCKAYLRLDKNGKVKNNPPERKQTASDSGCMCWIGAKSGSTFFEIRTGYDRRYDIHQSGSCLKGGRTYGI